MRDLVTVVVMGVAVVIVAVAYPSLAPAAKEGKPLGLSEGPLALQPERCLPGNCERSEGEILYLTRASTRHSARRSLCSGSGSPHLARLADVAIRISANVWSCQCQAPVLNPTKSRQKPKSQERKPCLNPKLLNPNPKP